MKNADLLRFNNKGRNEMKKKTLSMIMGLILGVTTVFGSIGTTAVTVSAASGEVTDADCADNNTDAPAADEVVPDANQYKYQKDELAAFCHFGPNTFNEVEWGENYGDRSPADIFTLTNDFDADTLVSTLKNAGFKKIIVTAKHHDGFCIWNSAYTDYCVKNTNYKNGEGDVLAEISAACTKYHLDMGLYLSPWDIHEPSYGYYDANGNATTKENDVLDYNTYYNNQLTEILSNDKYGNNGHFVEVWMDGAKGSGANAQEYDFTRWFDTIQKYEGKAAKYDADCMLFGAGAYTTVRWIGNEDGVAYEDTWSKSNVNVDANTIDSNGSTPYTKGYENGNKWTVPECDGRITSGWFWGTNKCTPKTISQLATMYFDSVGHNGTMLLNVPPNNQGTVDQAILDRVTEFGNNVEETFRTNLAKATGTTITASNVRGNDVDFKPGNVVDGDDATYWTTDDGTKSGSLTIKWDTAKKFDVVSIEEAIQKGQHINSYTVEYKTSDSANWQTLKTGVTIGAKRLIRTSPVSATQVRITVGTSEGKVPMLSEVGVYKASEGFQLAGSAPEGMETTSVNDTKKFTFSSTGWNPQTGSSYINGQNTWSNKANAEFTYTFDGTKVYLMGTKDPGHGSAAVYIDGQLVETINTNATSRSTGTKIFESADLTDGHHTLRVVAKTSAAIGVEAAYVINNGGVGMIELENSAYTMNEESTLDVKVKRVGGTKGTITAKIQPNPGSAIQDDFNTELAPTVTLNDGESEVTVQKAAETSRNTNTTGDRVFSIELTEKTPENAIIGFNSSARITIKDADAINSEKLQTLVNQSAELKENLYSGGWDTFAAALKAAQEALANESATDATIRNAYTALETAKNALVARTKYTTDDRFQFPWKTGTSATLEAEFATELTNSNDSDSDPSWPLSLGTGDWASNGKFLNGMAYKDYAKYAYVATVPGTYTVTGTYRAGAANKLAFSEENRKITATQVDCPSTSENGSLTVKTFTLTLEVTEAGAGTLILTAPDTNKAPQLDKFDIVLTKTADEADLTELQTAITNAEAILNAADKDKYSAAALVELQELVNAGKQLTTASSQADVDAKKAEITAKIADIQTQFTITATAGNGGKIAPTGATNVYKGTSKAFTITPNDGYHVDSLTVDGTAVDVVTEYTFSDVTANHTIAVTFAKDAMTVAKENLLAAINTANEKLAQTDAYTPASLEALQNAVDEAQTVYNKADATQTEVDNAKANVEAKIAALKEKADKSALRLAVKAAEGEAALTDKYTEESIAALQTAIDAANRVLADDNATQAEVDAQVEAVNAAKAALEEKKAPVVKEELEKAVADATEVVGATDKYTEASLAALQSAIDAANEVLQNSDATQDEIDAAVQAVKEARAALKAKDDDKKDDSNKDDDKKDDNNGSDNNGGNNNGNANNGSNNHGSFNNGSSNNGTANGTSNVAKAAKTGDTSNVAGMAMLCLAAGLVVVMAKRRRTN